ncbi:hypothetical protein ACROU3_04535 [Bacillus altitudinis]|uniref:hypothetical protein n=1 Tax=Bacillus altitudinis TaxID=293387 RepID=UPI003D795020
MNYLKKGRKKMDLLPIFGPCGSYVVVKNSKKGRIYTVEHEQLNKKSHFTRKYVRSKMGSSVDVWSVTPMIRSS